MWGADAANLALRLHGSLGHGPTRRVAEGPRNARMQMIRGAETPASDTVSVDQMRTASGSFSLVSTYVEVRSPPPRAGYLIADK